MPEARDSCLGELCIRCGDFEMTAFRGMTHCARSERQIFTESVEPVGEIPSTRCGRAAEVLRWEKEVALADGLRKTIHWFRNKAANSKYGDTNLHEIWIGFAVITDRLQRICYW